MEPAAGWEMDPKGSKRRGVKVHSYPASGGGTPFAYSEWTGLGAALVCVHAHICGTLMEKLHAVLRVFVIT